MSYKTILVHADRSPHAAARMALAIRVAAACQAHLTASAYTGISRFAPLGDALRKWPLVPEQMTIWREDARASLAAFESIASAAHFDQHTRHLVEDDAESGLMRQAPCSDLLVLSQTAADVTSHGVIRDLPQNLLMHCGRPLLLVPSRIPADAAAQGTFHHPLLAWDGSRQAARAISDALPLLKLAQTLTLLVLNAEQHPSTHGMEPGADMAMFLARHGVRIELMREFTTGEIGEALLSVAGERRCDLLVMGGYGHQRVREAMLGGVTHTVLTGMTLPVLISH